MATPPACFGFQYLLKIQASASLEFAILKNLNMSMNLFLWLVITICCCRANYGFYSRLISAYSTHCQPPQNTLGSITYYSATRVWISNTNPWRFWRCWSRHICSTGSFALTRSIVWALSKSTTRVSSCESDPKKLLRAHLVVFPNLFTGSVSHLSLVVLVPACQFGHCSGGYYV